MIMYKLLPPNMFGQIHYVQRLVDFAQIPFSLENIDYANFKAQINADEAQLEDADGNLMTAEQAKEFVLTLP